MADSLNKIVNTPSKIPEHEAIYTELQNMVLFGELMPGDAVTINGLKDKIGAGMTPIREAIRRLMAQGALTSTGTRRVVVPQLSLERLTQIRFVRDHIEPKLAATAAKNADAALIDELRGLDHVVNEAIDAGDVQKYLKSNYDFHMHLYRMADHDILFDIVHGLWLKAGPSLRVVCGKIGTANLPDMHDEALRALKENDYDAVGRAIQMDIAQGMNQIEDALKAAQANDLP